MANPSGEFIDHIPVTLIGGEEGEQVAHNMRQIMLGRITTQEAGPAFSLGSRGTLRVTVDRDTFEAFDGTRRQPDPEEPSE